MSNELLACPFCGSTSILPGDHTPYDLTEFQVACDGCGCIVDRDQWNRRAAPQRDEESTAQEAAPVELTGEQWHAGTRAFIEMYGKVRHAETTEHAQAHADTAAQFIYDAIMKASPPAAPVADGKAADTPASAVAEPVEDNRGGWGPTHNPLGQVAFRAGLLACREYMARFVEAQSPSVAASIRANWWPSLGEDPGVPRQLGFGEVVDGGDEGPWTIRDGFAASVEALPYALQFILRLNPSAAPPPIARSDADEPESYERRAARIGCRCTRPDARCCASDRGEFGGATCMCACHDEPRSDAAEPVVGALRDVYEAARTLLRCEADPDKDIRLAARDRLDNAIERVKEIDGDQGDPAAPPFDTRSPCGDPNVTVAARDAVTGEPTMFVRAKGGAE